MKFISWNVNGIRACIESKEFEKLFLSENADFFCVQETKLSNKSFKIELPSYKQFWNISKSKLGYSGTAIFCKEKPINIIYGLKDEYGENIDNEGRLLTLEFNDFYLINCYTPNSRYNRDRENFRLEWDDYFFEYIDELNNEKNVIICGDFNVAHKNIDCCINFKQSDKLKFSEENRRAFSDLLEIGLIDTFRYFHPQQRTFTWWNDKEKNIGWRLDYFLISEELRKNIRNADILTNIKGSDHSPIKLEVKL